LKIRKVVIPAAGLGTRLLPLTKVVPKEMLPVGRKPLIQYAVEEAAASGIETAILVLPKDDHRVADYFRADLTLEDLLRKQGRTDSISHLDDLSALIEVRTVIQETPRGLAHAIGCAQDAVGNEPFAVILPDALIDPEYACIRQLMDCYQQHPGCIVATRQVEPDEVGRFGILDVTPLPDHSFAGRLLRVNSLVERPDAARAPSRYGIFGRYVLEPPIFDCIDHTPPGLSGELQITDSLLLFSQRGPVYAYCFEGSHFDAGDQFGLWQAAIDYSLRDPELGERLREYLADIMLKALPSAS
jgi:UTP--glucose-1-phosphate uridylyltransferase